jgi:uncharacterized Zn-binding protein involved in type VI secretion
MAAAARLGDSCSGHGCWPPRTGVSASNNVIINGRPAHKVGDAWNIHCCPKKGCHPGVVSAGSKGVYINGAPAARIGDSINCGSIIVAGSSNTFFGETGGGGSVPVASVLSAIVSV